ncbi:MAG: dual specificity protein phosphatase family protein [Desulfobulbaceae bacterium]|nr:dual specificity protein phosphatase family protein [Desulfobulbaceae bacterium]
MYEPTWITSQLAVGHAPMSHEALDEIREMGIVAIMNLCAEFSDLYEIEEKAGFEVYYLPIPDECAPSMGDMEKALAWLDEAVYLGKKVLVHCRHGHGRTGTIVSAYLVRRGLGLKKAEKILKNTRASPTNFSQWKLLRKFHKQEGVLALATPRVELKSSVDLSPFFQEYEAFVLELDEELNESSDPSTCGDSSDKCCKGYFELQLAESIYLQGRVNALLSQDARQQVMERAMEYLGVMKTVQTLHQHYPCLIGEDFNSLFAATETYCPLFLGGHCLVSGNRPFRCRWQQTTLTDQRKKEFTDMLTNLSLNIFLALTGTFQPEEHCSFPWPIRYRAVLYKPVSRR